MKLLIAADIFPPQSGGPATYVVNLANALMKAGDEVRIVSLNPNSDRSAVSSFLFPVSFRSKLLQYLHYTRLLFKHAKYADVIYAMGPVNAGLPVLVVAKFLKKKFVVKVVGDYAWEQYQQKDIRSKKQETKLSIDDFQKHKGYLGKVSLLRFIERFVVRHADTVVVPSQYLKGIVETWGAKSDRVEVIHNAVDFVVGTPKPHDGEKWIVSVGRLVPWKGMDTLIEIMPELLKETPDIRLKIVGDGPILEELRLKVRDLRLDNFVELTGNLPKKDTLDYMASSDVFVLNSGYEGFSHVLIEAHNQGVLVLASRSGGNVEIVAGPALFEYNNKEEIREKILDNINVGKGKSIPHSFGNDMIGDTKKVLEHV